MTERPIPRTAEPRPDELVDPRSRSSIGALLVAGLILVVLTGCASKPNRTVVVEDRPVARTGAPSTKGSGTEAASVATTSGVAATSEAASNAGKPGFYTVKPGDTLVRIGLDHGQNWRDIARWNQIENPNLIEVGQVLRVRPEASATRVASGSRVERTERPASSAPAGAPRDPVRETRESASREPREARETRDVRDRDSMPDAPAGDLVWSWPAAGAVLQGFDEQRNKGLDIGGKAGDPVLAAADGRVVYAGSALRGYGNLVILKHNGTFLSAYAHNQSLLVKEDQVVKRGQKIAEMGNSDAERVQLHFEIRRDGKPVDPARYLPAR